MRYCSACGHEVERRVPSGDDRERDVCPQCKVIHYQNPRMIVGSLPLWEGRVLLCRRAISPRHGFWTLPAGFLENGESTLEGAVRETWEEARARLSPPALYTLFDLPHINQFYLFYRAELERPEFAVTHESSEIALFAESEIPWSELAFPVIGATLRHYFEDRAGDVYPIHHRALWPGDWAHLRKGP